jgi:hypothetical protein
MPCQQKGNDDSHHAQPLLEGGFPVGHVVSHPQEHPESDMIIQWSNIHSRVIVAIETQPEHIWLVGHLVGIKAN